MGIRWSLMCCGTFAKTTYFPAITFPCTLVINPETIWLYASKLLKALNYLAVLKLVSKTKYTFAIMAEKTMRDWHWLHKNAQNQGLKGMLSHNGV